MRLRHVCQSLGSVAALLLLLSLLVCSPACATITLTSNVCNNSATGNSGTGITCVLSATTLSSGSLLVCGMMWGNVISGTTFAISDPTNGTWTSVTGTPLNDGAASNSLYMGYVKNSSTAASLTITLKTTGGGNHTIRAGCGEWTSTSGWPTNPIDTQSSAADTGTSLSATPPTITPSSSGELIFGALALAAAPNTGTFTVTGTGFTERDMGGTAGEGWGSNTRATSASNENSGTSATAPTFNWVGSSVHWAAAQAAFKPGSGPTCANYVALTGAGCK